MLYRYISTTMILSYCHYNPIYTLYKDSWHIHPSIILPALYPNIIEDTGAWGLSQHPYKLHATASVWVQLSQVRDHLAVRQHILCRIIPLLYLKKKKKVVKSCGVSVSTLIYSHLHLKPMLTARGWSFVPDHFSTFFKTFSHLCDSPLKGGLTPSPPCRNRALKVSSEGAGAKQAKTWGALSAEGFSDELSERGDPARRSRRPLLSPQVMQGDEGWRDEGTCSLVWRRLCQASSGWGRALTNYTHLLQTQLKPG